MQVRLTGDPYIVHCVETACIVEGLLKTVLEEVDDRCWPGLPATGCNVTVTAGHLALVAKLSILGQCVCRIRQC